MSWAKFNSAKEKPAPKNACAGTKEGRAQKCEWEERGRKAFFGVRDGLKS